MWEQEWEQFELHSKVTMEIMEDIDLVPMIFPQKEYKDTMLNLYSYSDFTYKYKYSLSEEPKCLRFYDFLGYWKCQAPKLVFEDFHFLEIRTCKDQAFRKRREQGNPRDPSDRLLKILNMESISSQKHEMEIW